jgi:hypothetical protein
MLSPIQRHLELRHEIKVGVGALLEVTIADEFEHWRPLAAQAIVLPPGSVGGESPSMRRFRLMSADSFRPAPARTIRPAELADRAEQAERRHAASQSAIAVAT